MGSVKHLYEVEGDNSIDLGKGQIAQILGLNSQNDETDITYLLYIFCRNRITLSILQALFVGTNKRELSWQVSQ